MSQSKNQKEAEVWALFRELNQDITYEGFVKSERPDFIKNRHGVELVNFIQSRNDGPQGDDHMWEKLFGSFSKRCEQLWAARFPGRSLPEWVYVIPHLHIRSLEGAEAFRGVKLQNCVDELVTFVSSVHQRTEVHDGSVLNAGKCLAKYFQSIYVRPSHGALSEEIRSAHEKWGCWGYPRIAFGTSVGVRAAEIIREKNTNALRYLGALDRLDLLLYASGETTAASLSPWAGDELQSEDIQPGCFRSIWLLDVPGRRLFPVYGSGM